MHNSIKWLAVIACALITTSALGQTLKAPTWSLKVQVNGIELTGEMELAKIRAASGAAAADAVGNNAAFTVTRNSTFQLNVDLVNPNGKAKNITQSTKLSYDSGGCLTISPTGAVLVAPFSGEIPCFAPELPLLIITYEDPAKPASGTMNMYLFKVQ